MRTLKNIIIQFKTSVSRLEICLGVLVPEASSLTSLQT